MPISLQLKSKVADLIDNTEKMLATPALCSHIEFADDAKRCLMRQLFWAEQLLAAIKDGNYSNQLQQLDRANQASCRAIKILYDFHYGV